MLEDQTLIQRCQAGDGEAFTTLFQQHRQRVFSLACAILRDEAAAEDVVQETFLAIFQRLHTYRGEAAFTTWLTAVAVNQCRGRLRRRKLGRFLSLEWLSERQLAAAAPRSDNPAVTVADRQQAENVWQLVDRLDDRLRLPLLLRYRYDFSAQEVAELLGANPNRIYQQLYEGRQRLRRLVEQLETDRPLPPGLIETE